MRFANLVSLKTSATVASSCSQTCRKLSCSLFTRSNHPEYMRTISCSLLIWRCSKELVYSLFHWSLPYSSVPLLQNHISSPYFPWQPLLMPFSRISFHYPNQPALLTFSVISLATVIRTSHIRISRGIKCSYVLKVKMWYHTQMTHVWEPSQMSICLNFAEAGACIHGMVTFHRLPQYHDTSEKHGSVEQLRVCKYFNNEVQDSL